MTPQVGDIVVYIGHRDGWRWRLRRNERIPYIVTVTGSDWAVAHAIGLSEHVGETIDVPLHDLSVTHRASYTRVSYADAQPAAPAPSDDTYDWQHDGRTGRRTVDLVEAAVRRDDGTFEARYYDGTVVPYGTEDALRAVIGVYRLIFTEAELAEQGRVREWRRHYTFADGHIHSEPYAGLAAYRAALAARDADAAAAEVEAFYTRQGYTQYVGRYVGPSAGLAVIVRMKRQIVSKSGLAFLRNELALAVKRDDGNGEWSVFSALAGGDFGGLDFGDFTVSH